MSQQEENEVSLIEILTVIIKYRWMIICITVLTCVITAIYSFTIPNTYRATAIILPPSQDASMASTLASQLPGGLASLVGGVLKNSSELYVGMLKGRAIKDGIIKKFDLKEVYKTENINSIRQTLDSITFFEINRNGMIFVSVEGNSPQMSASIANEYVEQLKVINNNISMSSVKRERIFLEERIKVVGENLRKAQENLKGFQEKNKFIDVGNQGNAVIQAASGIQGIILAEEAQLKAFQMSLSPYSAKIKAAKAKIEELEKQLKEIGGNFNFPKLVKNKEIFYTPIANLPSLTLEYTNLLREVKVQETVFELLIKQYEMIKIQEAKENSNIQIFEYAEAPEKNEKIRPIRRIMVMISAISSLILGVFLSFIIESLSKLKEKDKMKYEALLSIKQSIFNDFKKIFFWMK